jgi:peptidoglycan/xylan/chitin deacetylase (PgdA/CDA1 family)
MKSPAQAVILLYHRVVDPVTDPQLLCVGIQQFAGHLAHLQQHYRVIDLRTFRASLREHSLPERTVVVTFDDGYADNLVNAKPLLERHAVPATMHVATRFLGQAAEFWWDDLENVLLLSPSLPETLRATVDGQEHVWQLGKSARAPAAFPNWNAQTWRTPTPRHQAYRDLHRLLRPLPADQQDAVLTQLRSQLTTPVPPRPTHRLLTPDELRSLAAGGLVEIGAHSVTHSMLTSLPLEAQRREMLESKRQLEAVIGRPVTSFAYPYGGHQMVSPETIALAKDCGFESACSTIAEPVRLGSDLFFLPRFLVRDWNGNEFARQLRGFFR